MAFRMGESIDTDKINLSYRCRECGQIVRGIPLTKPVYRSNYSNNEAWLIVKCPNDSCELSFVIYNQLNDKIFQVFPLSDFNANDYHKSIPLVIREDLAEASRCFYAGSYKGAVVMYRRALQNIVLDKIKDSSMKNKKLWEQIDALFKEGYITKHLKDSAHEIRHFGNFGAHPSEDTLDKTTREETAIIERLTFDLIRTIYINPFETESLISKRKG
jgi:hypothetical protein